MTGGALATAMGAAAVAAAVAAGGSDGEGRVCAVTGHRL